MTEGQPEKLSLRMRILLGICVAGVGIFAAAVALRNGTRGHDGENGGGESGVQENGATQAARVANADPPEKVAEPAAGMGTGSRKLDELLHAATLPDTLMLANAGEIMRMETGRKFATSVCADLRGNLWFGTESAGVQRLSPSAAEGQQWVDFGVKDGLGDESVYALACDQQGRIWVGHGRHGVSVFDGRRWQNYEVAAELSRPGSLAGPLGERVFSIRVCPTNGDVWMAASCGLARYRAGQDNWAYYTRAEGMPDDLASSVAFDGQGNIFVATQCSGVLMAEARDEYGKWRQVKGPDTLPVATRGEGLPTNLINDIMVAKDGTVYAATSAGVAWSKDHGGSWEYVRGADWAERVRGREGGAPAGFAEAAGGAMLAEDYCSALAEDGKGRIWVGYRAKGIGVLVSNGAAENAAGASAVWGQVRGMVADGEGVFLAASYGAGGTALREGRLERRAAVAAKLPSGAEGQTQELLTNGHPRMEAAGDRAMAFLGEDWGTRGDWVSRYGRRYAVLCAGNSPMDEIMPGSRGTSARGSVGPLGDGKRNWLDGLTSSSPASLWDPFVGARRDAQWNDNGQAMATTLGGPNLWVTVKVPEGLHRVSLYFDDLDSQGNAVRHNNRDFLILADVVDDASEAGRWPAPPEVRTRVREFSGGVYKQFGVRGPATARFEIRREGSINAICNGVFVDWFPGSTLTANDIFGRGPLAAMGHVKSDPPSLGSVGAMPEGVRPAMAAWEGLDLAWREPGFGALRYHGDRVLAYRLASQKEAPAETLNGMRWMVPLWTPGDREEWGVMIKAGWESFLEINPGLRTRLQQQGRLPGG